MTKDIVLEARKLVKQVSSPEGPLTIVDDVDFQVTAGESVAIVGASGAGKSTLLALLAAGPIMRVLGANAEAVITRLLGVLLAALAAQFVIDGLRASFLG